MFCFVLSACTAKTPSKETVSTAVKNIMPANFQIVSITPLKEMPGLIEVAVKMNNQPTVFYMDKKTQYLISGNLLHVESKKNLTIEAQAKIK
jgi:hypothetical protein